ncbi:hypothetical protein FF38_10863 [Lucilia cuprina]|uniref:Uncharacterized protein n=1 Tax=Lucilia cuprina TaxID=7375 RepID=A0A0L0CPV9_LUCCU|nr:hypothetical protein FF38_10863 [Lucilia cuprina]
MHSLIHLAQDKKVKSGKNILSQISNRIIEGSMSLHKPHKSNPFPKLKGHIFIKKNLIENLKDFSNIAEENNGFVEEF